MTTAAAVDRHPALATDADGEGVCNIIEDALRRLVQSPDF